MLRALECFSTGKMGKIVTKIDPSKKPKNLNIKSCAKRIKCSQCSCTGRHFGKERLALGHYEGNTSWDCPGLTWRTFYWKDRFSVRNSHQSLLQICFLSWSSIGCCLEIFLCAAVRLWELAWDHTLSTCLLTTSSYCFHLELYYRLPVFLKGKLKTNNYWCHRSGQWL